MTQRPCVATNEAHSRFASESKDFAAPFWLHVQLSPSTIVYVVGLTLLAAAIVALVVWVIALVGVKEVPLRSGFEDAAGEIAAIDASGAPR